MAENTKIEWTDHTFNPWIGCTKAGPGCDHCYAENLMDKRMGVAIWGPLNERVRTKDANWKMPLRWNAQADAFMAQHGRRQRVFCASLADVFDNAVDSQWRADLFGLIAATPNLDWLLLTKRIGNVRSMLAEAQHKAYTRVDYDLAGFIGSMVNGDTPPANVWIGATIVNQAEADRDIPKLLAVPARVRFLSMEPLLGPVDLTGEWLTAKLGAYPFKGLASEHRTRLVDLLDWVIVGGESGPGARPMHPDWARSLRDQCRAAGVPFLFKQWGEWLPGQNVGHPAYAPGRKVAHHQDGSWGATATKVNASNYVAWDEDGGMHRGNLKSAPPFRLHAWAEHVGKKAAGRLLDGSTWDGFPAL